MGVLAAVRQNGMALGIAAVEVQNHEIAYAAVNQDKRALQYVELNLRNAVAKKAGIDVNSEGCPWLQKDASRPQEEAEPRDEPVATSGLGQHFSVFGIPETAAK